MVFFILIALIAVSISIDYFRNYAGKENHHVPAAGQQMANKLRAA